MARPSIGLFFRGRVGVAVGYTIVVLIWGTTWYGVQSQVNGTSPHVAVALRLGLASLIFFAIARLTGLSTRLERKQFAPVIVQGACFFGVNYICVYTASQYLTSGVLAVVFSISVPFNLLAERVLYGVQPRPSVILAALIGVGGIALVFGSELEQALHAQSALWGGVLAVFAFSIVAVGNVLAARLASTNLGAIRLNAFGLAAGTVMILLWGGLSGASWSLNFTPAWLAGYVYLVVVGSVVAFGIYMRILPVVGPVAGAYVVVLSPVVAIGISAVLEGLPLGLNTLMGVALLLTGHSILVMQRRAVGEMSSPDTRAAEAVQTIPPSPLVTDATDSEQL